LLSPYGASFRSTADWSANEEFGVHREPERNVKLFRHIFQAGQHGGDVTLIV
jgi:hypothetical protein